MGGIAVKIFSASMEMVLFFLEICIRYILCKESNWFSAVFVILPPNCWPIGGIYFYNSEVPNF